jgi:hypothetical protein
MGFIVENDLQVIGAIELAKISFDENLIVYDRFGTTR